MIDTTISHYRITEKLGEGGMGVVYKAEDTKLERTVALKFLAARLLNDEEAKARFLREARAAAGLHHPNICPVYEIDEAQGRTFLSMAFIEGESLEARIERAPLPLKEALDIGRQVAEGLEAAHEKGVVHRDIKPANVMVDPKGRATIMDFGLARLTEASRLTKADQTMGTVAYMSPEQAQGMEVDNRSDIWALGVVLYEMVRGQRPFQGEYDQALLFEIVHQEPEPLTAVRAGVPMELEFIVGKCLAKDPADRYGNSSEIAKDLLRQEKALGSSRRSRVPMAGRGAESLATTTGQERGLRLLWTRTSERIAWSVAVVALLAVIAFQPQRSPVRAPAPLPKRFSFVFDKPVNNASISPDGRRIVFNLQEGGSFAIWVQDLDQDEPHKIVDDLPRQTNFAWSPDSRTIVYSADGTKLTRVPADGGPSQTIASGLAGGLNSAAWSPGSESVVFSSNEAGTFRLFTVPAGGGVVAKLFDPGETDRNRGYFNPHFIAGSPVPALLFDEGVRSGDSQIAVRNLETGSEETLTRGFTPVYSPSGHVIYRLGGDSWALPFSSQTLKATGEPFILRQNAIRPSVSDDGTLVYLPRGSSGSGAQLIWIDSIGKELGTVGQPQEAIRYVALSPDGARVAVSGTESGDEEIWIHDTRRPVKTRLTFSPGVNRPAIWSAFGAEIVFGSLREGAGLSIFRKTADGSGEEQLVHSAGDMDNFVSDVSADGRYIFYDQHLTGAGTADVDIWLLERGQDGEYNPRAFLDSPFAAKAAKLSPNGRWLAYVSDETGENEVYVQRFPEGGGKIRISEAGGTQPRWSRKGMSLYFISADSLFKADVAYGEALQVGEPEFLTSLFDYAPASSAHPHYDVSADESKLVVVKPIDSKNPDASIRVVQNWYEEFRDREQD